MSTAPAGAPTEWDGHVGSVAELAARLGQLHHRPDGRPLPVAGVLNLIAVPRAEEAGEVEALIESLADHQPSRAVVVALAGDGEGIDAHLEARAQILSGSTTVLVELVRLTLHGAAARGAASAVVPLLRSDLPTFLWWPGCPDPGDPVLASLAENTDRVVTEAGRSADGGYAIRCLDATLRGGGPALTDLSWAAITPWRQLVTQLVDAANAQRLRDGSVAEIWHGGDTPTAEALLLAGWLRDALGERLMVELHGRPDVAGRGLVELHLEAAAGRRLSLEAIPDRASVAVSVSTPLRRGRRRVLPLPVRDRGALLAGELEIQRRDRPFERAVPHAVTMIPS